MTKNIESSREMRFYIPYPKFPSVSVTGGRCQLNCKHCRGHYLRHMPNVDTPEKLKKFCDKLDHEGGTGILISGGSTIDGRVPLERFYPALKWVKRNTDLIVNIHTGFLDVEQAGMLSSAGVDIASVDVVGSNETIKEVYGLKAGTEAYWETLRALKEAGVPTIAPHICVGLDYGKVKGEYTALDMTARIKPEVLVILGLIPTVDTPMANTPPPSIKDILAVITQAKKKCPETDLAIGCMRSRAEKNRMEEMFIRAGVNRMALPSRATIEWAKKEGLNIKMFDACCTIPKNLEHKALRP